MSVITWLLSLLGHISPQGHIFTKKLQKQTKTNKQKKQNLNCPVGWPKYTHRTNQIIIHVIDAIHETLEAILTKTITIQEHSKIHRRTWTRIVQSKKSLICYNSYMWKDSSILLIRTFSLNMSKEGRKVYANIKIAKSIN